MQRSWLIGGGLGLLLIVGFVVLNAVGVFQTTQVELNPAWDIAAAQPISFHVVDLDGDDMREIFVEDDVGIAVLETDGRLRFRRSLNGNFAADVMQIDADPAFEIVVYNAAAEVSLLDGTNTELGRFSVAETLGGAGRMRIAGPDQDEIVLADETTRLAAFSADGTRLWSAPPIGNALRALVRLPDELGGQVVVGAVDGTLAVVDARGRQLWQASLAGDLRRLRAFPVNGTGQVFASTVNGNLTAYDALTGAVLWSANFGQAIDEIRAVELDGDPATTEIALGGRDGGVWGYDAAGTQVWRARVPGGVRELASLTSADYGDVLAVGDTSGQVTFFDADGARLADTDLGERVSLLQTNPNLGNDTLLVGSQSGLRAWTPALVPRTDVTLPLAALGVLLVMVLAGTYAAHRLALVRAEETERSKRLRVLARSEEELQARWRTLREKARDLDDAHRRGDLSGERYLIPLRELRDEMALVAGALEKRGITPDIRMVQCPSCGAPVDTRNDTCEFCGAAVAQYALR